MLVLNATYEPINVCTVRRAVVLLLKDKAEVIEPLDDGFNVAPVREIRSVDADQMAAVSGALS